MSFGAYGLRFPGLEPLWPWLVAAPANWPEWQVGRRYGEGRPAEFVNDTHARFRLQPTGFADIDRVAVTTLVSCREPGNDPALLHPYLATTGIVTARWAGDHAFHGGAFVVDGVAWAVLAARDGGKSTTLAALALLEGVAIVSDDVVVVSDGDVLAGPRCVDLRRAAAEALGAGELVEGAGARDRWRVRTAPVPSATPLAGLIVPAWGLVPSLTSVPVADRLPRMMEHIALRVLPDTLDSLLEMAALPMLQFTRPRDLGRLHVDAAMLARSCQQLSAGHPAATAAGGD